VNESGRAYLFYFFPDNQWRGFWQGLFGAGGFDNELARSMPGFGL